MSDTLWGVIIGGAIGLIGSLIVGLGQHCRWQKEFTVQHLRDDRERREKQRDRIVKTLIGVAEGGLFTHSMGAEFAARCPSKLAQFLLHTVIAMGCMSTDKEKGNALSLKGRTVRKQRGKTLRLRQTDGSTHRPGHNILPLNRD